MERSVRPTQPLSIGRLLELHATHRPDAIAIAAPGRPPLTYRALLDQVRTTGRALASLGVAPEEVVATVLPDGPEAATAFLGIASHAIAAPLNPGYRERELEFFLGDLAPKAVFVHPGATVAIEVARRFGIRVLVLPAPDARSPAGVFSLESLREDSGAAPLFAAANDVALLLHTSGTTSRPKQVPLTHANLCASAGNIAACLRLDESDRSLLVMPLFHCHGLVGGLLSSLAAGGSVACTPGFHAPSFRDWVRDLAPTWYTAVPSMHQSVLAHARAAEPATTRLRLIRSCSAPLPPPVMAALERTFGVPVIEAYGMTEAAHQMASNPLPPRDRKPGSVGIATGVAIAIASGDGVLLPTGQRGEVVIRGEQVTPGYRSNDAANAEAFRDGWFRTGDEGYLDSDGYLFITGRLKEIINRAGEKIAPREIEDALLEHPAVEQAMVFSIPDPVVGEEIAAAVVLRPGMKAAERDLQETLSARLVSYKVPRRIVLLDELPKGPTGKPQRVGMAEKLGLGATTAADRPPDAGPRSDLETHLARIWASVLRVDQPFGIHQDFFAVGGDSILAGQLLTRIRAELGVPLTFVDVFRGPTIAQLASMIVDARCHDRTIAETPIEHAAHEGGVPLALAQQRMWYLEQLYPGIPAYRPVTVVRFTGPLQVAALERALTVVVERHEALRARFEERGGVPVQFILPPAPVALPITDLRGVSPDAREDEARVIARDESWAPFDLARGPMYRARLLQLDAEDHLLLVTIHHIAFDAWSRVLLLRELSEAYNASCRGTAPRLPELPITYSDYSAWQLHAKSGESLERDRAFWRAHLGDIPPVLELPADRPRPATQSFQGNRAGFDPPEAAHCHLDPRASRGGDGGDDTPRGVSGVAPSVYAAGHHRDRPPRRRPHPGRDARADRAVRERARAQGRPVRERCVQVRPRPDTRCDAGGVQPPGSPFDELVRMLRPARDLARSPLFQIAFYHHTLPGDSVTFVRWPPMVRVPDGAGDRRLRAGPRRHGDAG